MVIGHPYAEYSGIGDSASQILQISIDFLNPASVASISEMA